MSDLLAIIDSDSTVDQLAAEIRRRHPSRVTLLVEEAALGEPGSAARRLVAERAVALRGAIEAGGEAVVVGLASSAEQLSGWRFDRIIGARPVAPAF